MTDAKIDRRDKRHIFLNPALKGGDIVDAIKQVAGGKLHFLITAQDGRLRFEIGQISHFEIDHLQVLFGEQETPDVDLQTEVSVVVVVATNWGGKIHSRPFNTVDFVCALNDFAFRLEAELRRRQQSQS